MAHGSDSEHNLRRQLTAFSRVYDPVLGRKQLSFFDDRRLPPRAGGAERDARQALGVLAGPGSGRYSLRAGVGWKEGYVGQYEVPPYLDTPIGHSFALSEPVPISDYTAEQFYRYPPILKEHGCVSSLNVPLRTDRELRYLGDYYTSRRQFSTDDVNFLTGLGNTVARAVELRRAVVGMESALDEKQLLIREMNHRIKNNLSLVAAMLSLQGRRFPDPTVRDELANAVSRINNLALVHDRLQLFTSSVNQR